MKRLRAAGGEDDVTEADGLQQLFGHLCDEEVVLVRFKVRIRVGVGLGLGLDIGLGLGLELGLG